MRQQLVSAVLGFAALTCILAPPAYAVPPHAEGQLSVVLHPEFEIHEVNERWGTTTIGQVPPEHLFLLGIDGVADLEAFADSMQQDPAVASAEPNYLQETPEAVRQMVIGAVGGEWSDYEDQELTERIGLTAAHQISRGAGVIVAVLDTGVDPSHPALAGRLSEWGFDFVDDDLEPWEERNGLDDDGDGLIDEGYGHGTMVAGIIALIAPEARILPIRILDDEGRTDAFRIAQGLWHASLHGAHVVNMSFGAPIEVDLIEHMIAWAYESGMIPVGAAGNENSGDPPYSPGCSRGAFMVTAVDSLDVKAEFADYHSDVLVSAPGVGVRSAYPGGEWGIGSGCSFATPIVAGEVALLLSVFPDLTWDHARDFVEGGVVEIDHLPGNEPYAGRLGDGRVYLPGALEPVASSAPAAGAEDVRVLVHPNPARDRVVFRLLEPLTLAAEGWASLSIHDARGRLIASPEVDAGGTLIWSTRGTSGHLVPSGTYYLRLPGDRRAVPFTILR